MMKQPANLACTVVFLLLASFCASQTLEQKYDELLQDFFPVDGPGGTALVSRNGEVIYQKAFGKANLELDVDLTPDFIFRIGSITKQFTACAILRLADEGKLSLEDDITRYIEGFPANASTVTIEHLLTHTSGLVNDDLEKYTSDVWLLDFTPRELVDYFKDEPLRSTPGEKFAYNNVGYNILGYIIEKITGKSYGSYIEDTFFKLLGMHNSSYRDRFKVVKNAAYGYRRGKEGFQKADYSNETHVYAAGNLLSNAEDLSIWNNAVSDGKVVSKEMLEKAFTPYQLNDGSFSHYGYGWHIRNIQGRPMLDHGGLMDGFSSQALFIPEENVCVVILSNIELVYPQNTSYRMAAIAIDKPFEREEIQLTDKALTDFEGVYEAEDGKQRIVQVVDGALYTRRVDGGFMSVVPFEENTFSFKQTLGTLQFQRNDKGDVTAVISNDVYSTITWDRTQIDPKSFDYNVTTEDLQKYVGIYHSTYGSVLTVTLHDNQLSSQIAGRSKLLLIPTKKHAFAVFGADNQYTFKVEASGNVSGVTFSRRGTFKKHE